MNRTTDNRTWSDQEAYLMARIEALQIEVRRLTLEVAAGEKLLEIVTARMREQPERKLRAITARAGK